MVPAVGNDWLWIRINHDVLTVIEGIHKEREVKQEVL
jgi:hypothetical protein